MVIFFFYIIQIYIWFIKLFLPIILHLFIFYFFMSVCFILLDFICLQPELVLMIYDRTK